MLQPIIIVFATGIVTFAGCPLAQICGGYRLLQSSSLRYSEYKGRRFSENLLLTAWPGMGGYLVAQSAADVTELLHTDGSNRLARSQGACRTPSSRRARGRRTRRCWPRQRRMPHGQPWPQHPSLSDSVDAPCLAAAASCYCCCLRGR